MYESNIQSTYSLISLILPTIHRTLEFERLLNTLVNQSFREFELIIVDQNDDDRIKKILSLYSNDLCFSCVNSESGVSRARNKGIGISKGEIIAFPDDDCWYHNRFLAELAEKFIDNPQFDGMVGRIVDQQGKEFTRFPRQERRINKLNSYESSCTAATFLRRGVVEDIGEFDEQLGPGADTAWKGGEDTDYILRCIEKKYIIQYDPEIIVFHPQKDENYPIRAYNNGAGIGRVWRKHKFPRWYVANRLIRPLGGVLFSLLNFNFQKYPPTS